MHGSAIGLAVPPQLMIRVCVRRMRNRSDLAARQLWNAASVVGSQTFTVGAESHTQVPRLPFQLTSRFLFPAHLVRVAVVGTACRLQVHTVARVPLGTLRRERSAPSATVTRGTSCTLAPSFVSFSRTHFRLGTPARRTFSSRRCRGRDRQPSSAAPTCEQ